MLAHIKTVKKKQIKMLLAQLVASQVASWTLLN